VRSGDEGGVYAQLNDSSNNCNHHEVNEDNYCRISLVAGIIAAITPNASSVHKVKGLANRKRQVSEREYPEDKEEGFQCEDSPVVIDSWDISVSSDKCIGCNNDCAEWLQRLWAVATLDLGRQVLTVTRLRITPVIGLVIITVPYMERLKTRTARESCSERNMRKFFGTLTTWGAVMIGVLDFMALEVFVPWALAIANEWQELIQTSETGSLRYESPNLEGGAEQPWLSTKNDADELLARKDT
jgi:hypothetical protein